MVRNNKVKQDDKNLKKFLKYLDNSIAYRYEKNVNEIFILAQNIIIDKLGENKEIRLPCLTFLAYDKIRLTKNSIRLQLHNTITNKWVDISKLSRPMYLCLVSYFIEDSLKRNII